MKKVLLLLFCLLSITATRAQVSMGLIFEIGIGELQNNKTSIDRYLNGGFQFKKPLSLKLNLVTGITAKFYESDVEKMAANSDMITFVRDQTQTNFTYFNDYITYEYAAIPIGLEYKLNTRFRLSYRFENNFLIGTNEYADEYLQYGRNSLSKYTCTHSAAFVYSVYGLSMGLSCTTAPQVIKNQTYNYNYMYDFSESLSKSYMLNIIFSYDFPLLKIKKIL